MSSNQVSGSGNGPATPYFVGFDIGGTRIKAIAVSEAGNCLAEAGGPTRDGEWEGECPAFAWECRQILQVWQQQFSQKAAGIGVAAPGVAAKDESRMVFMVGRMSDVVQFDFARCFESDAPVPVLNDAHAALVGEAWIGAARGLQDVALLTLGTGVGGAMMLDGRLIKGAFGRAGHFGHCCIDLDGGPGIFKTPGVMEDFIGNYGVSGRTQGRFSDTRALVEAAATGDVEAERIWNRSVQALACGIANIGNMIDPEAIVIGGGIAEAGAMLWDRLESALDRVEWRPNGHRLRLLKPVLGEWAGAYGAARRSMAASC